MRAIRDEQIQAALKRRFQEIANPLDVTLDQVRAAKAGADVAFSSLEVSKNVRQRFEDEHLGRPDYEIVVRQQDRSVAHALEELMHCRAIYEDTLRCYLEGLRLADTAESKTATKSGLSLARSNRFVAWASLVVSTLVLLIFGVQTWAAVRQVRASEVQTDIARQALQAQKDAARTP